MVHSNRSLIRQLQQSIGSLVEVEAARRREEGQNGNVRDGAVEDDVMDGVIV